MKRVMLVSAAFIAFSGIANAEMHKLTGAEIVKLLAGRTLYGPPELPPSQQMYDPSGATVYQSEEKQLQGRWKVVGDKYCSSWDEKTEPKCSDVFIEPPAVGFVSSDGEKHLWYLTKP